MKLGIAGTGWAGSVHALASAGVRGIDVAWIGSRTNEGAERLAALVEAPVGTYAELPRKLDALVVATPPTHHLEMAEAAIARDLAVLIEKPLTATLAEADRLIDLAGRAGVLCCYAENLLFAPAVATAQVHLEGRGPLRNLEVRCLQGPPTWGHFLEPLEAGGVVFDLGPHPIALAVVLAGAARPVGVAATLRSGRDDGADDAGELRIRFDDGLVAELTVSWTASEPLWDAQAATDDGVVVVRLAPEAEVEVDGEPVAIPRAVAGTIDPHLVDLGYANQLSGLVEVMAGRGGQVCPAGFGRMILEIICAAYASAAAGGSEVTLPFTGDRTRTPLQLWRG